MPRKSKKAKKDAGSDVGRAMVEQLQCPITSEFPVCPVVAQDGRVYERDAIERWLSSKATSPVTNAAMGTSLVDSTQTRTLILTAIEGGSIDDDSAAVWHLESAKAIADGKLTGALTSVKDHLESADELSSSPEIKLSLEAVNLKLEQDTLLKRGADAGAGLVASVLGGAKTDEAPMTEWRALRQGKSVIRVISNLNELKRLCMRPAPGASAAVKWIDAMETCCGRYYFIAPSTMLGNQSDPVKGYNVLRLPDEIDVPEANFWAFPFDACILVAY